MALSSLAKRTCLEISLRNISCDARVEPSQLALPCGLRGQRSTLRSCQSLAGGSKRSYLRRRFHDEVSTEGKRLPVGRRLRVSATALKPSPASEVGAVPGFDWDNLGFGLVETDFMFVMNCERDGEWQTGELKPYGNLEISPSSGVLNYGQGVFEGLKAYNTEDGRILLFRLDENASRMASSADRMSMPSPPSAAFQDAVIRTVKANRRWIPPPGKGSLYIRPLLIGTGPILGLAPAPDYTFLIYVSPVGNYFKGGTLTPIKLKVEETYHRAAPGGTGAAKTISNYAPVLKTQLEAKKVGFSDVLYLDAVDNKYIEEVSSCNIFVVKDGEISTPGLKGTILPGITRKSIIELGRSLGYKVSERQIAVEELMEADEVFCTGTAVVVSPVGSMTFRDTTKTYGGGAVGEISQKLYTMLTDLQMGKAHDSMGWTYELL